MNAPPYLFGTYEESGASQNSDQKILNTEISPDVLQRLRVVSKIMAKGAIRAAAHVGISGTVKRCPSPPAKRVDNQKLAQQDEGYKRVPSKRRLSNERLSKKEVTTYE
jgi:hypothetical protein